MLAAGCPSSCWGGALCRACNLTVFTACLTGPVDYPFASRHEVPGFKSPGGYLCETGISPVSVVSLQATFQLHFIVPCLFKLSMSMSISVERSVTKFIHNKHEHEHRNGPGTEIYTISMSIPISLYMFSRVTLPRVSIFRIKFYFAKYEMMRNELCFAK